jgi:Tol biopolymer transport system component
MNCRECGAHLSPDDLVCGNCGALVESVAQPIVSQPVGSNFVPPRKRRISSTTVLLIIFSVGMLGLIVASAIGGVVVGLQDREGNRQAEADKYYQEGLTNFATGKLELARADFEYVLRLEPSYPGASEQLSQVQARLTVQPTPTSPSMTKAIDQLFQTGQDAYDKKDWANAVEALSQVRSIDPTYEKDKVAQMIYTAALTYGQAMLQADRLEEGVAYLDQAAYVKPLPAEAALASQYAKMYLTARGYWNANWGKAIERFKELYAIAPNYKDVFTRLVEAYINYGDESVSASDYCTAQQQYEAALQLRPDSSLQTRLDSAKQNCLVATPGAVTGTAQSLVGLFAGRLAYPALDQASSTYRIDTASAGNPTIFTAAIGDQPEWQRTGSLLAYRVAGVGINVLNLATGNSVSVAPAGAAYPTLSTDGTRLIYSLDGTLYIANVDGSGTPISLGAGTTPVWGPNGLLAYSGCDAGGTCGIMIRNPDQANPPTRLTASSQDIPTSWSPDGNNISYFSNVTGEYDLFFVNTAGGVQQVTKGSSNDIAGAWGPDGAHIAFLSDRDGSWGIYIAKFDGSDAHKIVDAPQDSNLINKRLSWMP